MSGRAQKKLAESEAEDRENEAGVAVSPPPPLSPLIVLPTFSLPYL